jgi:translation initiation factor 1
VGLVYSTEGGRVRRCQHCGGPLQDGRCDCRRRGGATQAVGDGVLRVRRETSGRRGKTVTTVQGAVGGDAALRELARSLKQRCGSGGAVKDGVIELQGDHRDVVVEHLRALGHTVKLAGG